MTTIKDQERDYAELIARLRQRAVYFDGGRKPDASLLDRLAADAIESLCAQPSREVVAMMFTTDKGDPWPLEWPSDLAQRWIDAGYVGVPLCRSDAPAPNQQAFAVDVLGNPMREYAPGKWENAVWPSDAPAPEVHESWNVLRYNSFTYQFPKAMSLAELMEHAFELTGRDAADKGAKEPSETIGARLRRLDPPFPAAHPQGAALPSRDEREAFEAWWSRVGVYILTDAREHTFAAYKAGRASLQGQQSSPAPASLPGSKS